MKNIFDNAISSELFFVYALIALVIILIIVIVVLDKKESKKNSNCYSSYIVTSGISFFNTKKNSI